MNLIQEFHTGHQKVVTALFELREAIAHRDIARVRSILGAAEGLVGPHFKFEELHLYPALERFLGDLHQETLQRARWGLPKRATDCTTGPEGFVVRGGLSIRHGQSRAYLRAPHQL